jgi:hypothetical protein
VDVEINDPVAGSFPLKCVSFDATVLHLWVHDFSRLSLELSPPEIILYMNMFMGWMRESIEQEGVSVVERFLDSSVVLLFSTRFGSANPFFDALRTARWLGDHDGLLFKPDMGIASGEVAAGFTGTPKEYAASVFGRPLLLAAASARMKPLGDMAARITFPEAEWQGFSLDEVFPLREMECRGKERMREPSAWQLGDPRSVDFPGIGETELRDICSFVPWVATVSAREKAREWFGRIKANGYYKPQK